MAVGQFSKVGRKKKATDSPYKPNASVLVIYEIFISFNFPYLANKIKIMVLPVFFFHIQRNAKHSKHNRNSKYPNFRDEEVLVIFVACTTESMLVYLFIFPFIF